MTREEAAMHRVLRRLADGRLGRGEALCFVALEVAGLCEASPSNGPELVRAVVKGVKAAIRAKAAK